ncbi:MAG TPA: SprT-like domain-containing protein [Candidatus Acidoferrum sp.]|nr:SprT-like domain-containing protein [Candidatus Acidoferrum sp.]
MRRLVLLVVSLACLGTLLGRSGYANSHGVLHETLAPADLHRIYLEVNHTSFAGKLPDVPVTWGDLSKDDAYGITHFDKDVPYAIEIDRQSVHTESFARDVIRHETCHIATIHEAKRLHEDQHGATFFSCMARLQDDESAD